MNRDSPVFLVGSGRSGTTLVQAIPNAGGEVYFPCESGFAVIGSGLVENGPEWSGKDYDRLAEGFVIVSESDGWGLDSAAIQDRFREGSPRHFSDAVSLLYRRYLKLKGRDGRAWGVKAPYLVQHVNRIFRLFPHARIVHVVRDGRDVALSCRAAHAAGGRTFGPKSLVANALYWVVCLRALEKSRDSRVFDLRYEDLLRDPQASLAGRGEFLGIDIDTAPAKKERLAAAGSEIVQAGDEMAIHEKIFGGLDEENSFRHRHGMGRAECGLYELIAGPWLRRFGYTIHYPFAAGRWFSPLRFVLYLLADVFNATRLFVKQATCERQVKSRVA